MEPIISPIFIYMLGIVDDFKSLFIITAIICISLGGASIVMNCMDGNNIPRHSKLSVVIGTIALILYTFIPNKETLMTMYASKYVTVNNIKLGKEVVVDTVKEIVDIINKEDK